MTNTPENMLAFFMLYFGQEVMHHEDYPEGHNEKPEQLLEVKDRTNYFLTLYDVHDLTDEHAQKIFDRQYKKKVYYETAAQFLKDLEIFEFHTQEEADILRSMGYHVGWGELTEEEILKFGWVRIKKQSKT